MINLPSEVISPSENPNDFPILVALQRIKSMLPTGAGAMNSVWKLTVVTRLFLSFIIDEVKQKSARAIRAPP